jgi:hypothetical protein
MVGASRVGPTPGEGTKVDFTLVDGAWDKRVLGAGARMVPTLGDGARCGPTLVEGADGDPICRGARLGAVARGTGAGVVVHAGAGLGESEGS